MGNLVGITVKDAEGVDVALSMQPDEFVAFLAGFQAL